MNSVNRVLVVLLCGLAADAANADGNMRCGSKLIEVGMTQSDVLDRCGPPTSKTEEAVPVRSGNQVTGTTLTSRWTYDSYGAIRVLTFDQDTLKYIE